MQTFDNPAARNPHRAAADNLRSGSAIGGGGNQSQGRGELPSKVSVPLPGTNATQAPYKGGSAKAPAGFNSGLINGKI